MRNERLVDLIELDEWRGRRILAMPQGDKEKKSFDFCCRAKI